MVRKDRLTHAGGVAILYKNIFKVKNLQLEILNWKTPSSIELLCLSFQFNFNKSFVVCVLYRTDNALNDIYNLDLLFQKLLSLNRTFFVLGDFNFNLLNDKGPQKVQSLFNRYNLKQLVDVPTRGKSLLDFIITNYDNPLQSFVEESYLSDHLLTTVKLELKLNKQPCDIFQYRDFREIDLELMNSLVRNTTFLFEDK